MVTHRRLLLAGSLSLTLCLASGTAAASVGAGAGAVPRAAEPNFGATWVADRATNELVEYAPDASGAAAAIATISGAATGLDAPSGVAVDPAGNVFVANAGNDSITEYVVGASGDVTPTVTIAGAATGLDAPSSVSMGTNELWVTDPADDRLEAFSLGVSGNVLPAQTIAGPATRLNHPIAVSAGPLFGGLWVLNQPLSGMPSVESFGPEGGNVAPYVDVHGPKSGLDDPTAIVAESDDVVDVAEAGSNAISEFLGFEPGTQRGLRIHGAATRLDDPVGLSVDALGRLSVLNAGDDSIRVFSSAADGNARPVRTVGSVGLGGSPAALNVLVGPPSAPTDVRVVAINHGARVTWHRSAISGGGIVHYNVIAIPDRTGTFGYATTPGFGPTSNHETVHGLVDGVRYEFFVEASNEIGIADSRLFPTATPYGPPSRPRAVAVTPSTSAGSLDVVWARPVHANGKRILGYDIRLALCHLSRPTCRARTVTAEPTDRSRTITGLKTGAAYHVEVVARNTIGRSQPSASAYGRAR